MEGKKMELKVYADRMSQPSRAIIIFCKANGIDFEEIKIELVKRQHLTPEFKEPKGSSRIKPTLTYQVGRLQRRMLSHEDFFKEINPMGKVPAIVDEKVKLFESHAILIYLATAYPGVADHWYPADLCKRAKIHSVLDWHHSNLRHGSAKFVFHTALAPAFGLPLNPEAAAEALKLLSSSLSKIESFWLEGEGPFLLGSLQPSIADISLVCEIMQLEVLDEEVRNRILKPHKKVQQWIKDTESATMPHFGEVHTLIFGARASFQKLAANSGTSSVTH